MKRMTIWKGLVLSACVAFAAAACGDDDPSKNPNNTTANNTSANNTSANNTSANNTTANNTTANNTTANNTSNNDLCADVDCSTQVPEPTCDGNVAVTSTSAGCDSATGTCDFDEMRDDCGARDQVCVEGACMDEDLCANVDCGPADAPSCNGDTAVVPEAPVCNPDNGMCETESPTETDCSANDQVCMDGMCVDDSGPCANVTCDQPANVCDGQELVEYSGAGMCDMGTGECDFTAVETRTDCTANGEICVNAACVADDDDSVSAGDLVITEFMQNPNVSDDPEGEWFEIYNTTARTLDIEGLVLNDGANNLTVAGTGGTFEVPGFSYLLVGRTDDMSTNGSLPTPDIIFPNLVLANGDDEIRIYDTDGTTLLDEVAYDDGAGWPDGNGASAQFGIQNDLTNDDNGDPQFWCENLFTSYGDGDFGTPGAPNVMCDPPPVAATIYEVQDETEANHPTIGTNVLLSGVVVTATDGDEVLFVQETAGGQYSGISIDASRVDISTLAVGDVVDVEGVYLEGTTNETDGRSFLTAFEVTSASMTANVTAEIVASADLATDAGAEPWEGVLIQIVEPAVTDSNPDGTNDFGEFRLDAAVRVDDALYDYDAIADPANCWTFDQLTGPLERAFGNFKIIPRDTNDFVTADTTLTSSGAVGASTVGAGGNNFTPADVCVDAGGTVTWTWAGGLHDVESRDAGASMPAATKVLDSPDLMTAGDSFAFTFADAGTYHYLCSYHPSAMQGRIIVLE